MAGSNLPAVSFTSILAIWVLTMPGQMRLFDSLLVTQMHRCVITRTCDDSKVPLKSIGGPNLPFGECVRLESVRWIGSLRTV